MLLNIRKPDIGMRGPKGYGFSVVLVIIRVSILAGFGHFDHKECMVFVLYGCVSKLRSHFLSRVRNCDQLVANATENLALATRISRPVASRRLTFSIVSLF